jgi:hypothetical protein
MKGMIGPAALEWSLLLPRLRIGVNLMASNSAAAANLIAESAENAEGRRD